MGGEKSARILWVIMSAYVGPLVTLRGLGMSFLGSLGHRQYTPSLSRASQTVVSERARTLSFTPLPLSLSLCPNPALPSFSLLLFPGSRSRPRYHPRSRPRSLRTHHLIRKTELLPHRGFRLKVPQSRVIIRRVTGHTRNHTCPLGHGDRQQRQRVAARDVYIEIRSRSWNRIGKEGWTRQRDRTRHRDRGKRVYHQGRGGKACV